MVSKPKTGKAASVSHKNEPRDVGYSADVAGLYQNRDHGWLRERSGTIFSGRMQKDLFIFAMALAKHREKKIGSGSIPKRVPNIPVGAMDSSQKWELLSIGIADDGGLLCLKDETEIYRRAEGYAHEGIQILQSRIEKAGGNYPKALEVELREILGLIEE